MSNWFFLILFTSFLIHFQVVSTCEWIGILTGGYKADLFLSTFVGISYLLYPLYGWLAEVCFDRIKMIQFSFVMMLISSMIMFIPGLLYILKPRQFEENYNSVLTGGTFIVSGLIGLGLYEANAIQFGMDQMLEASSERLSSFIHWYIWCVNLGSLITYSAVAVAFYFYECAFNGDDIVETTNHFLGYIFVILSCLQILLSTTGIFLTYTSTKCLGIQQTSRNPLKMIVRVLVFAVKHKDPIKRSAFTYWENDIPSRIDLGKEKYGGPFTYEEVEDVKTMFRLLLLMFSLFGLHLSGDGYSLTTYIVKTVGCPTLIASIGMILNPQNVTVLIVIFAIPFHQFMKKYLSRYTPSLLTRLWIGLLFCLLSECIQSNFSFFLQHKSFTCPQMLVFNELSSKLKCVFSNMKVIRNGTCEYFCSSPSINYPLVYLSLVPLILNSLSYLLVFLTTIEFICAQSPNAMKGLLIGIWYSMLSIKYVVVNNLDFQKDLLNADNWNIYHGIKGFGIFLSIICFSLIYKRYRYREREEIVNEYGIIEQLYERELLMNSPSVLEHTDD